MTDYKVLCAELLSEYEDSFVISEPSDDPLVQRARAALAGDTAAARQFLLEAGFTDEQGQLLPQYQPEESQS